MKVNEYLNSTGLQPTGAVTFDQLRAILEDPSPSAQAQSTAPAPSTAHVATPSPATPAPGSTPPGGVATPPAA